MDDPAGGVMERARGRLSGARVVVTGGLGFIGSNAVHRLVDVGVSVVVLDALVPDHGGDLGNLEGLPTGAPVEILIGDIGDERVGDAVANADVVFNIAGQVNHLASMERPLDDFELNVRSHVRFLEILRRAAPNATVVLTSTRQVYGRPRYLPVDEQHPTTPVDVNGVNKLMCEQLHLLYGRRYALVPVVLRLTNVYGPRQHLHRPGLGFLPEFLRRALAGDDIVVFGDGTQRRDCVYVDDVIDALLLAATTPAGYGQIFNLGHPDVLSLREIARIIQEAAGEGGTVTTRPWDDALARIDIGDFHGDFGRARQHLGWTPRTRFGDGIRRTLAALRSHIEMPRATQS